VSRCAARSAGARCRGRPVPGGIGRDPAVGRLAMRFGPRGEEGSPSRRDDPGVLARAIDDKTVTAAGRIPRSGSVRVLIHHVRLQSLVDRRGPGRHRHATSDRITDASLSGGWAARPPDSRRTACYHPRSEPVLGPVGMCGFDRAWLPGNASRGRHWASLIRWQKEVPGNRQSTLALAA
jgi:hypothetical protein